MKIFICDSCGHPVFFENSQCLHCGSMLAFIPNDLDLAAVFPVEGDSMLWRRYGAPDGERAFRLCQNQTAYQTCNFAVEASDASPYCVSCRQTRILPDLSQSANFERWNRIEMAKRRLFYSLARLGLVSPDPGSMPDGPVFEFLADLPGGPAVMTGHRGGVITLNVSEADDDERARRRIALHEPYRTLLGHLRHESGHYYWDRLIRDGGRTDAFREIFGDESLDYGQALQAHYANQHQPPAWQEDYVTAYAAAHPWEDWAETWAHYLHMVDLLETAAAYSTRVVVPGSEIPPPAKVIDPFAGRFTDFDEIVRQWVPVTLLVNSLNRSLGQNDAYPFALTAGSLRKLRSVHEVIREASVRPQANGPANAADSPGQVADHQPVPAQG
ncbi:MAG: putative zinc-binding peptidase [Burkholderiaceae bacterium]